jgi:hypothetical protein
MLFTQTKKAETTLGSAGLTACATEQVDGGGFHRRVYGLAEAQIEIRDRLRGYQRHQREAAIELDACDGALPGNAGHAAGEMVASASRREIAAKGDILGAEQG